MSIYFGNNGEFDPCFMSLSDSYGFHTDNFWT